MKREEIIRTPEQREAHKVYLASLKREEVREGIAKTLYRFEYDGWEKQDEGSRVKWLVRAEAVMNNEHSQGVVIKVDRELPAIDFDDVSDIERTRLMNSVSHHTVDILREAGLVFTLPLIEEGE